MHEAAMSTNDNCNASLSGSSPPPHQEPLEFKFKCSFSGTVSDVMKRRGWTHTTDASDWNIFWCDMNQARELFSSYSKALQDHQRVGHFRNVQELSRKNMLVRNLQKFKYKLLRSYGRTEANKMNFLPLTYILPAEHQAFVAEQFSPPSEESNLWIIKPAAGAQGRGIFIFKKYEEYNEWRQNFEPHSPLNPNYNPNNPNNLNYNPNNLNYNPNNLNYNPNNPNYNPNNPNYNPNNPNYNPNNPNYPSPPPEKDFPGSPLLAAAAETINAMKCPDISFNRKLQEGLESSRSESHQGRPRTPRAPKNPYGSKSEDVLSKATKSISEHKKTKTPDKKQQRRRDDSNNSRNSTSPDLLMDSLENSDNDDYMDSSMSDGDNDLNNIDDDDDILHVDDYSDDPTKPKELRHEMRQDAYVVQKYISNPYLIGGRKFDIRFYVLVTSYNPLVVWVYREGFARFSAGQFSLDALQDVYIHLTNVAIQKTSEGYNAEKGSKWSLKSLREYLTARHGPGKVQKMFNLIDVIVIRTLQSVCKSVIHDKHCFEIYGFDVLIDKSLVPWLLEVNACPSFTPSNEEDYVLKCGLIDDTASILDIEGRLTGLEKRVGGYDLIWKDGPIYANPGDCGYARGVDGGPKLNTFLGCRNDRVQQLRELYKTAYFLKGANKTFRNGRSWVEGGGELNLEKFGGIEKNMGKDKRFRFPKRWSRWSCNR